VEYRAHAQETAGASGEILTKSRVAEWRHYAAVYSADVLMAGMQFDFCAVRLVGGLANRVHAYVRV